MDKTCPHAHTQKVIQVSTNTNSICSNFHNIGLWAHMYTQTTWETLITALLIFSSFHAIKPIFDYMTFTAYACTRRLIT